MRPSLVVLDHSNQGVIMTIEVNYHQFRKETEDLLDRVEEGETIVITQKGEPVAELIPHREENAVARSQRGQ
jgi:prevent-host-death family protein